MNEPSGRLPDLEVAARLDSLRPASTTPRSTPWS